MRSSVSGAASRITGRRAGARLSRALLALSLAGCSSLGDAVGVSAPAKGEAGYVSGFLGGVTADEPQAALVARDVLSSGGSAADAAVALGFALAVTLPSRAGLGGGGACLAYAPGKGGPEAIVFVPRAPAHPGSADRPASVPMLARGLYLLHAHHGTRAFDSLIAPAELLARGTGVASRAFVRDLAVVAAPLSADPGARAIFFPNGQPPAEGARLLQPGLGGTLAQLRLSGVGDLYQGALAHLLVEAGQDAGAGLSIADLRGALPQSAAPLTLPAGPDVVAFLPPPADGGLAAAAAFQDLARHPSDTGAAGTRALSVAARWRQGGGDPAAVLAAPGLPAASMPALPASTSFAVVDRDGNAVVCALTMNNLFGTGRVAAGTGMVLAASPSAQPPPLLSAALVYSPRQDAFRAAVGGTGQAAAPLATAVALTAALAGGNAVPPEPGRANTLSCPGYLPGDPQRCVWTTDPRGFGVALGGGR